MIKKRQISYDQTGFTLIELMIAAAVFSLVLLAAGTALVQVSRMYYRGVITSRTQGATRTTMDDIARTIQFTGGSIITTAPVSQGSPTGVSVQATCIGDTRYTYALNTQVNDDIEPGQYDSSTNRMKHALWLDKAQGTNCATQIPDLTQVKPSEEGRELLDQHMRLTLFSVKPAEETAGVNNNGLWHVDIGIAYGDSDILNFEDNVATSCKGVQIGAQWCAVSALSTNVYKRVE